MVIHQTNGKIGTQLKGVLPSQRIKSSSTPVPSKNSTSILSKTSQKTNTSIVATIATPGSSTSISVKDGSRMNKTSNKTVSAGSNMVSTTNHQTNVGSDNITRMANQNTNSDLPYYLRKERKKTYDEDKVKEFMRKKQIETTLKLKNERKSKEESDMKRTKMLKDLDKFVQQQYKIGNLPPPPNPKIIKKIKKKKIVNSNGEKKFSSKKQSSTSREHFDAVGGYRYEHFNDDIYLGAEKVYYHAEKEIKKTKKGSIDRPKHHFNDQPYDEQVNCNKRPSSAPPQMISYSSHDSNVLPDIEDSSIVENVSEEEDSVETVPTVSERNQHFESTHSKQYEHDEKILKLTERVEELVRQNEANQGQNRKLLDILLALTMEKKNIHPTTVHTDNNDIISLRNEQQSLKEQLIILSNQNVEKEGTISSLRDSLNSMKQRETHLEEKISYLVERTKETSVEATQIRGTSTQQNNQIIDLESQLVSANKIINEMKQSLDFKIEREAELMKKYKDEMERSSNLQLMNEQYLNKQQMNDQLFHKLESSIKRKNEEIRALQKQIQQLSEETSSSLSESERIKQKMEKDLKLHIERTISKKDHEREMEELSQTYRVKLKLLQEEIAASRTETNNIREQFNLHQLKEKEHNQLTKNQFESQIAEVNLNLENQKRLCVEKDNVISSLESRIELFEEESLKLQVLSHSLQTKLREVELGCEKLQLDLESVQVEKKQLEEKAILINTQIKSSNDQVQFLQADLDLKEKQVNELKMKLETKEKEWIDKREDRKEWGEQCHYYEMRIKELEEIIEVKTMEIDNSVPKEEVQNKVDQLNEELMISRNETEKLKKEVILYKTREEEKSGDVLETIDRYENRIVELHSQLNTLKETSRKKENEVEELSKESSLRIQQLEKTISMKDSLAQNLRNELDILKQLMTPSSPDDSQISESIISETIPEDTPLEDHFPVNKVSESSYEQSDEGRTPLEVQQEEIDDHSLEDVLDSPNTNLEDLPPIRGLSKFVQLDQEYVNSFVNQLLERTSMNREKRVNTVKEGVLSELNQKSKTDEQSVFNRLIFDCVNEFIVEYNKMNDEVSGTKSVPTYQGYIFNRSEYLTRSWSQNKKQQGDLDLTKFIHNKIEAALNFSTSSEFFDFALMEMKEAPTLSAAAKTNTSYSCWGNIIQEKSQTKLEIADALLEELLLDTADALLAAQE